MSLPGTFTRNLVLLPAEVLTPAFRVIAEEIGKVSVLFLVWLLEARSTHAIPTLMIMSNEVKPRFWTTPNACSTAEKVSTWCFFRCDVSSLQSVGATPASVERWCAPPGSDFDSRCLISRKTVRPALVNQMCPCAPHVCCYVLPCIRKRFVLVCNWLLIISIYFGFLTCSLTSNITFPNRRTDDGTISWATCSVKRFHCSVSSTYTRT